MLEYKWCITKDTVQHIITTMYTLLSTKRNKTLRTNLLYGGNIKTHHPGGRPGMKSVNVIEQ